MAAPSGTVWGSIVGGYGRIGIYKSVTNTDTKTNVTVELWFWSKYSVSDTGNTVYYNNLGASGSATTSVGAASISTTVDTGAGWSTSNQVRMKSYTYSYNRGTTAATRYLYAKLTDIDRVGGTMYASTTFSIPKLESYTVSYHANNGSGAPSAQTKWFGTALTLSSTKPTRTGYSFSKWNTAAGGGGTSYNAGASYTANAGATLYAQWTANTYTVSYNANGGSGAPASQTKTYGVTLKLSSTKPTRTNYEFLGWSTSKSATTEAYDAGGSFTTNANTTLYAVWKLAYTEPRISSLTVTRCDPFGNSADDGVSGLIEFDWECDNPVTSIKIKYGNSTRTVNVTNLTNNKKGRVSEIIGDTAYPISADSTCDIVVTVTDSGGSSDAATTLSGSMFPIDAKAGGDGVSFGKPAELGKDDSLGGTGVADFGFDAKFNEPVYGNVFGLNRLPEIPANSELNDYMETGCWAIYRNDVAATITCGGKKLGTDSTVPPARACRFEVNSATGEGIRLAQWSYLRQRIIPYNSSNPTWEREITRDADNVWHYYEWWKSNLTPAAAANVYHEQKLLWGGDLTSGMYMTEGHTANLTEKISDQPHGIILVFSAYESASDTNYNWQCFFVPKLLVSLSSSGHTFELSRGKYSRKGTKYLYIYDDHITGHADNNLTGTSNGITYANNKFVLRYVIGV